MPKYVYVFLCETIGHQNLRVEERFGAVSVRRPDDRGRKGSVSQRRTTGENKFSTVSTPIVRYPIVVAIF
jgi:hypothetical protein